MYSTKKEIPELIVACVVKRFEPETSQLQTHNPSTLTSKLCYDASETRKCGENCILLVCYSVSIGNFLPKFRDR